MTVERIAQAIADLDAWLETMRQPGGYGGPVAHWWQHRFQYTGPGLDWRYEGILIGYALLRQKTHGEVWLDRLRTAAADLIDGQLPSGAYPASRFEANPDVLGTPHEAAASLGLLAARPELDGEPQVRRVVERNLQHLVQSLQDGPGLADRPGGRERVPNKLATMAQTLMTWADVSGDGQALALARTCLDDVLRFQVTAGRNAGAVHQYAPDGAHGDGRFFPYYAARCVPPLMLGAQVFGTPPYAASAEAIVAFLDRTMSPDGSWPQVVYSSGRRSEWPRWIAGVGDIAYAYVATGKAPPIAAMERLLAAQQPSGAFPTAEGFASRIRQTEQPGPDIRDVFPVVGWNDKVLRLLATLLPEAVPLPPPNTAPVRLTVREGRVAATYVEDTRSIRVHGATEDLYVFEKARPWARICVRTVDVR